MFSKWYIIDIRTKSCIACHQRNILNNISRNEKEIEGLVYACLSTKTPASPGEPSVRAICGSCSHTEAPQAHSDGNPPKSTWRLLTSNQPPQVAPAPFPSPSLQPPGRPRGEDAGVREAWVGIGSPAHGGSGQAGDPGGTPRPRWGGAARSLCAVSDNANSLTPSER